MIKRMRIKIIIVTMAALIFLLTAIFITTNIFMRQVALNDVDAFLLNVVENNGRVKPKPETELLEGAHGQKQLISGVSLKVSSDGEINEVLFNEEQMSASMMSKYTYEILLKETTFGSIDTYRYQKKQTEDGYLLVFANTSIQNSMIEQLQTLSISMGFIAIGFLLILVIILSKYITRPVDEAIEKQKRFIADSSHELKTPLSVMSANLDMLEMEIGRNSRTLGISDSIKRINKLIHELLILTRTEQKNYSFLPFNLSEVMESTILTLEVIAYEHGNQIETTIDEDIVFNGNEEGIRKMIEALMENAIKYSRKNTTIKACLYTKSDHIIIEIFNEGIGVVKEQKEKLFDKFYRVDDSRHRETGGYGIGLSIVKNIVDMHKGKIHVDSVPDEYIVFKITLHG